MPNKNKRIYILALNIGLFYFTSCSSDHDDRSGVISSDVFALQIVDSLQIDYLGEIYLVDQNSQGQFLLQDLQRDTYLVANSNGQIIHQFTIKSDDKDYPGISFESPAFYKNDQIVFNASKGLFFFDFEGNFLTKTDDPLESNVYISRRGTKAIFEVNIDGEEYLLTNKLAFMGRDANTQAFYDNFLALNRFHQKSQETQGFVGLEPSSVYRDGRHHSPGRLLNRFDVQGNQLAVVYSKDNQVYRYTMHKDSFELLYILPIAEEVNYLDKQKEREKPRNPDEPQVVAGFQIGGGSGMKMGESRVTSIALLDDELVMVQYNPGLPEDVREEAKIIQQGDGIRIEDPDNIPREHYVVFKDGKKAGGGELPIQLKSFIFERDGFLWFSAEPNEQIEEDFVTWYKVKLMPI